MSEQVVLAVCAGIQTEASLLISQTQLLDVAPAIAGVVSKAPCVAWRRVLEQSEERALRLPQQEQPEQPQRQQGISGGGASKTLNSEHSGLWKRNLGLAV